MPKLRQLLWPLLVSAAVALLLAPGLAPGRTLAWRDALREYAPLRAVVVEALRQGRLPLWDPFDGAGTPLFAQLLHGVLHPVSVTFALLAPGSSFDALLAAYVLLAALGAWVAARTLDVDAATAAVAAIGYAGSGPVLANLAYPPFLAGAASLPWVVAAARRAGQGLGPGAAGVALAFAALLLSGDLQSGVVVALLAVALAFGAGAWRGLGRAAAGLVVGSLLAGIQLVPSWAFLQRTARGVALSEEMQRQWALSPWRLLELVAPGLYGGRPGSLSAPVHAALDGPTLFAIPFLSSVFLGVGLVGLAVFGARERQLRATAVGAVALLWLALGHHLGAQQLLQAVPVWGQFRYSEKLMVPLALCVALLAAAGARRLAGARPGWAAGSVVAAAVVAPLLLDLIGSAWLGSRLPAGVATLAQAQLGAGMLHLAAGLAGLGAVMWLGRRRPTVWPVAALALVLIESLSASPMALAPGPAVLPSPPSPAAQPPGPRLCTPERGQQDPGDPAAVELAARLESALGYPGYNVSGRIDNIDIYSGLVSRRFEYLWDQLGEERWRAFRRFAVTHVALPAGARSPAALAATSGGVLQGADARVEVWSVPHRPWATFALSVRSDPRQLSTLSATVSNLKAERSEVVLETAVSYPVAPGRVLSVKREAERLEIEAEADGPAVLVVNDAYWPGWVARIDGAEVPVVPADVLVRAVPFPAGRHRLVMVYAPPEVAIGWWCSAAGLAALVALAWLERRRNLHPGKT